MEKKTAPNLKDDWQFNFDTSFSKMANARYIATSVIIEQLTELRYKPAKSTITEFEKFWKLHPQLGNQREDDAMTHSCKTFLKVVSSKDVQD